MRLDLPTARKNREGGPWAVKKETRPCALCGTPVTRRPSEFKTLRTYCSHRCSGRSRFADEFKRLKD